MGSCTVTPRGSAQASVCSGRNAVPESARCSTPDRLNNQSQPHPHVENKKNNNDLEGMFQERELTFVNLWHLILICHEY